jgi:hypothetical protein
MAQLVAVRRTEAEVNDVVEGRKVPEAFIFNNLPYAVYCTFKLQDISMQFFIMKQN